MIAPDLVVIRGQSRFVVSGELADVLNTMYECFSSLSFRILEAQSPLLPSIRVVPLACDEEAKSILEMHSVLVFHGANKRGVRGITWKSSIKGFVLLNF